jgi:hypothetical protein
MAKTIYNPVTKKYYKLREKSSKPLILGSIRGLWNAQKEKCCQKSVETSR